MLFALLPAIFDTVSFLHQLRWRSALISSGKLLKVPICCIAITASDPFRQRWVRN